MTYFKLNNTDYSQYVNKLQVGTKHNYLGRNSAAGNLLVKYVNSKKVVQVGIIPLNEAALSSLLADINKFQVTAEFRDPETKALHTISGIIPENLVEYYTIQAGNVRTKAFAFTITEV